MTHPGERPGPEGACIGAIIGDLMTPGPIPLVIREIASRIVEWSRRGDEEAEAGGAVKDPIILIGLLGEDREVNLGRVILNGLGDVELLPGSRVELVDENRRVGDFVRVKVDRSRFRQAGSDHARSGGIC